MDARAPRHAADRPACTYTTYSTSTVHTYFGSKYPLPGVRSTATNPSAVPTAIAINPTNTLVLLIRSSNSSGGNLHTTSLTLRVRSNRPSTRYITLITHANANAAYASTLNVTCNANTAPCAAAAAVAPSWSGTRSATTINARITGITNAPTVRCR